MWMVFVARASSIKSRQWASLLEIPPLMVNVALVRVLAIEFFEYEYGFRDMKSLIHFVRQILIKCLIPRGDYPRIRPPPTFPSAVFCPHIRRRPRCRFLPAEILLDHLLGRRSIRGNTQRGVRICTHGRRIIPGGVKTTARSLHIRLICQMFLSIFRLQ